MLATKTNTKLPEEKVLLPFHNLMFALRQHGFLIKPEDYIEILKVVEKFGVENIENGAPILCPLVATSPEEQERFYKVYEEYNTQRETKEVTTPAQRLKWWIHTRRWWLIAGAVVLTVAAGIAFLFKAPGEVTADFTYRKTSRGDAKFRVGDTLQLDAGAVLLKPGADSSEVSFFWNTGSGFKQGAKTETIVIDREGTSTIQLRIRSAEFTVKDSIKSVSFPVCPQAPQVDLTLNNTNYSIGDELVINQVYSSSQRFKKVAWKVNNVIYHPFDASREFRYQFKTAGTYFVSFTGWLSDIDNEKDSCAYTKAFNSISVNDKTYTLQARYTGQPVTVSPSRSVQPLLNWLLLLPALLIGLFTFYSWNRRQKRNKEKKKDPPSFTGKKPPYETPFENKDLALTQPENAFGEIIRSFRQKAQDDVMMLNVPQSIQQTIRTGGIPELVFTNRLRYTEYIVLIDRSLAKSMQVHLFDYLVKLINEGAVNVERFYYTGNFERIFNESTPDGVSFKRFSELYKTHTLIIMGHARQLVYNAYPVLEKNLADILNEWEYKAILTPVPYKDWDQQETLIAEKFVLLPADLQGQLKLIQAIREKQLDNKKYFSSIRQFYEAAYYDFHLVEDLKTYLGDDVLFQWLCAAAVYHKLRWEIVIETGKAICAQYNQSEKVNFTNLLKLARISWMDEGAFPAATRLDLLKHLTISNEVVAREILLLMMQHAETYFGEGYFFEEEKEIQKITSRFLLYAYDPKQYAGYAQDQEKFGALMENDKLWDKPQRVYLENPDAKWPTLINHNGQSTGVERYFQLLKMEGFKSSRKALWRNGIIAASFVVLLGLLHLLKDRLPDDSMLVRVEQSTGAVFSIIIDRGIQCESQDSLSPKPEVLRATQGALQVSDRTYALNFDVNNRAEVSIPVNMPDTNGLLVINWNNGQPATATSLISLKNTTIQAAVSACASDKKLYAPASDYEETVLASSLHEIWKGSSSNRLMTFVNNQILHYSTGDKKTYGTYIIEEVLKNKSGMYKIVTQTGNEFKVFLIQNVRPDAFELSVCNNRYNTIEEAISVKETSCEPFSVMTLYYEKDSRKIFLPLNPDGALNQPDQIKINNLKDSIAKAEKQGAKINIAGVMYYNSLFTPSVQQEKMPGPIFQYIPIKGTPPFERSYVTYSTGNPGNYSAEEMLSQGHGYYQKQDYKNAIFWYTQSVNKGNTEALLSLAWIYEQDYGYKDVDKAIKLYMEAAQKGSTEAMWRMGYVLFYNKKNISEGIKWIQSSAESGDTEGMYVLANIYASGEVGFPKDERRAVDWYKKAMDAGHAAATGSYGIYLYQGLGGLKPDEKTGLELILQAYQKTNDKNLLNFLNSHPRVSEAPRLLSPANNQTFDIYPRTTKLVWNSVTTAKSYQVETEYSDPSKKSGWVPFEKKTVGDTTYTFNFIGAQPGRWRVYTIDNDGNLSEPSAWRQFSYLK